MLDELKEIILSQLTGISKDVSEVKERVARIEENTKDHKEVRDKAVAAFNKATANERSIKEIQDSHRWLNRVVWGAAITSIVALILSRGLW